jgi:hypothetical protein
MTKNEIQEVLCISHAELNKSINKLSGIRGLTDTEHKLRQKAVGLMVASKKTLQELNSIFLKK